MEGIVLFGWDDVNKKWIKCQVTTDGKLIINPTAIIDDTPEDGVTDKAISSNWAYDHKADASAHHSKYTDDEARASIGDLLDSTGKLIKTFDCNYLSIDKIRYWKVYYSDASDKYFMMQGQSNSVHLRMFGYDPDIGYVKPLIRVYDGSTYHSLTQDDHDHTSGNGAQIDHTTLSNIGTKTHAQLDSYLADLSARIRVEHTTGQTINATSNVVIQFDTETYDNFSEYDNTTNYRFTASSDGTYQIYTMIMFAYLAWTIDDAVILYLYINGSEYSVLEYKQIDVSFTRFVTLRGNDTVELSADDYVEIVVFHNHGSSRALYNNGEYNRLIVNKLK